MIQSPSPKRNVSDVFLAKCRRSLFYTTTYFIKSKSEVLSKFKEYVNSVEKQTGSQIIKLNILAEEDVKVLRSDDGGEYTSNNFTKFCAEIGISHKFTVPYCPQQNGVSERKNRTIMEKARSMLHQAKLPLEFWAEACSTAVYLLNRSPTTALKNETPFERLVGTKTRHYSSKSLWVCELCACSKQHVQKARC